ncbi:UNVERIFIED_CONTAM: hypothetical protein GTU68_060024 [Idotea baltica]|nr:hypothetical protein [Idotea baltica]
MKTTAPTSVDDATRRFIDRRTSFTLVAGGQASMMRFPVLSVVKWMLTADELRSFAKTAEDTSGTSSLAKVSPTRTRITVSTRSRCSSFTMAKMFHRRFNHRIPTRRPSFAPESLVHG